MNNHRCSLLLSIAALIGCFTLVNGQTCPTGFTVYFDPSNNAAVPCTGVGGSCPARTTCTFQPLNSLVLQNLCCLRTSCSVDEILIAGQCFAKASPGKPCELSDQCSGGTTCTSNICQ